uniref:Putative proteasome-associated protein ecm29 n=1 Tax=Rhodnius neglectus TaxID=72488 RepID=A0A0N7Z9K2_9HEMI
MGEFSEEAVLLERMFLRIVMCDTDEQFEDCLQKFLPTIITKSGSHEEMVRNKVVELLSHISKRVKASKSVKLPLDSLVELYQNPNASIFIINFTIIYIKMGFVRLPKEKKVDLLPILIKAAENKPIQHQESICILLVSTLMDFKYPREEEKRKNILGLSEWPKFKKLLLEIMLDVLLFPYGCTGEGNLTDISVYAYKRLTRDGLLNLTADAVEKLKQNVTEFAGVLGGTEVYPHLVVASGDARTAVADIAESEIKKQPDVDLESITVVAPLYTLYLREGTGEKKVQALNMRTRIKLIQHMTKFRALPWPSAMKVLFESLYGSYTNSRLRILALGYFATMIKYLPQPQMDQVWVVLLNAGLMKLLSEENNDVRTKLQAYHLFPTLILRCPHLAVKDLSPVEFIFKAIDQEAEPDIISAARDAAVAMARAYRGISGVEESLLKPLLVSRLEIPASRAASVRFMVHALKHSCDKVYLLIKASVPGKNSQVRDEDSIMEAKKALYSGVKNRNGIENGENYLVPFSEFLKLVLSQDAITEHSPEMLVEIITYLRLCLACEAGIEGPIDNIVHPSDATSSIRRCLASLNQTDTTVIQGYINIITRLVLSQPASVGLSALLEVVGCLKHVAFPILQEKLKFFKQLTKHVREDVRCLSSEVLSFLVPMHEIEELQQCALETCKMAQPNKEFEEVHGAVLRLGHLTARSGSISKEAIHVISDFLSNTSLCNAAITSLGLMCIPAPLPITSEDSKTLTNKLLDMIFDTKLTSKVKDRTCTTLSQLAVSEESFQYKDLIIERLMESCKQIKDVELCLATGETVASCILGRGSSLAGDPWTKEPAKEEERRRGLPNGIIISADESLSKTLGSILGCLSTDRHPATRQTLCFWLLAITKQCNFLPSMSSRLSDIQGGFMDLLSDSNALLQEGAGKGLSLVYDATQDPNAKRELLRTVVDQLTAGRKSVAKVSDDTKLFQEGELGETPSGGKLSTYKELCQLATDLNQPDLIYKFMHLANHNAVWNSKKGAAYTISSLVSKAGTDLDTHLPQVLVKLYRYQYDPVPHIQQSMASIWSSLAPPDTLEKYYKEIFNDLLVNLTAVHWRVRISCCLGFQDFIRGIGGNNLLKNEPEKIGELWRQLYRVMDDIHEGTRNTATSTAKILSKICIRECQKDMGKAGRKMAGIILPIILDVGIKSRVPEIRSVSISTLTEVVKGSIPREDTPSIVLALLRAGADLENSLLNAFAVRVSGVSAAASEALDVARVPAMKSHYLVQALVTCVPYVDAEMLGGMQSEMLDLLKPSAGFGTRIATSHFVVLLSHHLTKEEFQPYVGKFLGGLLNGLSDRSPGLRNHYASCIGQILRTAKDSSVVRLLEKLKALYLEKHEEAGRRAVCHTLQAIVTYSQDCIRDKQDLTLPLVFFAKHLEKVPDGQNNTEFEEWGNLWEDLDAGFGAMANSEGAIVDFCEAALGSQLWKVKAQAGRAIATLCQRRGEDLQDARRHSLLNLLIGSLSGRTWDGKEDLLHALAALMKYPKCIEGTEIEFHLIEAMLKECKKENAIYKRHALRAVGDVMASLSTDYFDKLFEILNEIFNKDDSDFESGDKDNGEKYNNKYLMLETCYETLSKSWPKMQSTQEKYCEDIVGGCVQRLRGSTRQVQVAVMSSLCSIADKSKSLLRDGDHGQVTRLNESFITALDLALSITKHTKLRKEALNLLQILQNVYKDHNNEHYAQIKDLFDKFKPILEADSAPEIKSRFIDIKESFQKV